MAQKRQDRRCKTAGIPWQWNPVLFYVLGLLVLGGSAWAVNISIGPVLASWAMTDSADAKNVEYQLKAAFLYNFMKFIEWPQGAEADTQKDASGKNPITLCVLGTDLFGKHLDDLTKKEVKNRPIRIVRLERFETYQKTHAGVSFQQYLQDQKQAIETCHLLFISQTEDKNISELVAFTEMMKILTVSDIGGFVKKGGVIEFVMESNKIRFDVNVVSADKKGLKISSQLLQLAREVKKT